MDKYEKNEENDNETRLNSDTREFQKKSFNEIIKIKGLNPQLYLEIETKAKDEDRPVAELINEIFYNYISGKKGQINSFVGFDGLKLSEEGFQRLNLGKMIKIEKLIIITNPTIR